VTADLPWYVRIGLAVVIIGLLAATLILSFVHDDAGTRNLVVGAVLTYAGAIIQYYFGSSESSRNKDDTIGAATVALATSTPGPLTTTTVTEPDRTTTTTGPTDDLHSRPDVQAEPDRRPP
jgi:type II secretory pathway pseudopilin PulG